MGSQGLKPLSSSFLNVAAEAATHKEHSSTKNIHPQKTFTHKEHSSTKNIHPQKTFTHKRHSPTKDIHPQKTFTHKRHSPTKDIHPQKTFTPPTKTFTHLRRTFTYEEHSPTKNIHAKRAFYTIKNILLRKNIYESASSSLRSILDSVTQGNKVLRLVRFLDAVVDEDGKHDENPHGEDAHAGNCFGDQAGQQCPPATENYKQDNCRCHVRVPTAREEEAPSRWREHPKPQRPRGQVQLLRENGACKAQWVGPAQV